MKNNHRNSHVSLQTNHFNIGALMETGVRLIGNGQAPVHKYWKHLMDLIQKGEINPLNMVTHRLRLEDIEKVYEAFDKRKGMQKIFLQTRHSNPPTADELVSTI